MKDRNVRSITLVSISAGIAGILFSLSLATTLVFIWLVGLHLLQELQVWLPLGLLTFTTVSTSIALFINNYLCQRRNLGLVRTALQQHMPDHAARKLGQQIVTLENEHQLAHGVCLVTDIRLYSISRNPAT